MNSKKNLSFFKSLASQNINVIDASIPNSDYIAIDLSQTNSSLKTLDVSSSQAWENYIGNYLKTHNKKVAFGGYLEKRGIYNRSDYFNNQNPETERNIHIGLDLWIAAGTPVLAAFNGEIHSFKDNTNFGDYGPTIILKHTVEAFTFYTLYGHLSRESLIDLKVGAEVKKGEVIAHLGKAEVNGDYAPHLHFQIILDLQDKKGDYPGVCSLKDLDFYKANTINPELILGL
ncbi:peptidoglycan DD-metalloendopeptidase family protein [Lacinutrix sp. 5H-3-7-4]|uniref:peptidoglycan DD-metalloendopeptidase family protein n=1 Tax=Lacinutrix sp. (strain 5H-3-7-4) TaxID=983544 RepID=UPI00020A384D|nr:peptidoglycan DD-metalloendopeptidase family protein [Lacinutrix sp. 5H-3-7-4]AEG99989.1 Peptidase M23 [Lacinutrix sp. 5H-3-7-4]